MHKAHLFSMFFTIIPLKEHLLTGCSKTSEYKAREAPRSEAYLAVRCNDEGNVRIPPEYA